MNFKEVIAKPTINFVRPTRKRRKNTAKKQQAHFVNLWRGSHMRQAVFCQHHNINIKTFSRWIKETEANNDEESMSKIKVQEMRLPSEEDSKLELIFPNGITMYLRGPLEERSIFSMIKEVFLCKFN